MMRVVTASLLIASLWAAGCGAEGSLKSLTETRKLERHLAPHSVLLVEVKSGPALGVHADSLRQLMIGAVRRRAAFSQVYPLTTTTKELTLELTLDALREEKPAWSVGTPDLPLVANVAGRLLVEGKLIGGFTVRADSTPKHGGRGTYELTNATKSTRALTAVAEAVADYLVQHK